MKEGLTGFISINVNIPAPIIDVFVCAIYKHTNSTAKDKKYTMIFKNLSLWATKNPTNSNKIQEY